ncbi:MAG: hypothetical protein LBU65_10395 [Planctomycetaceae bacterium]|jgi:hypothetical protein|nr:hypothetical protein [Planctomycetaceae bacterium]
MYLAVRTRGYNNDYVWDITETSRLDDCRTLGAILDDSQPGFIIRKNGNGRCDIILGCIKREGKRDYRDRQIVMQVLIGDITEQESRSLAVAVLKDWNVTQQLVPAVQEVPQDERRDNKDREWKVDYSALERSIRLHLSQVSPSAAVISGAWEKDDNTAQQAELAKELEQYQLSAGAGLKIYCGGSPNTSDYYMQLRREADRFYWNGCDKRIDLIKERNSLTEGDEKMSKKVFWGTLAVNVLIILILMVWAMMLRNESFRSQNQQLEEQISVENNQKQIQQLKQENSALKKNLNDVEKNLNDTVTENKNLEMQIQQMKQESETKME